MLKRLAAALLFLSVWLGGGYSNSAEARPPDKIGKGCVSGQCHSQVGRSGRTIHRPAKFGHCAVCHKQPQPRKHRFKLDRSPRLCLTCHRRYKQLHTKRRPRSPSRVKQLAKWDCLSCHNPHQSPRPALLRKAPTQLCQTCHQGTHLPPKAAHAATHPQGSSHPPVRQGACLNCHRPHTPSPRPRLMRANVNKSCIGCHRKQVLSKKHKGWTQLHPKLASQCNRCHQPHASPHPKLLRQTGSAMCLQCHSQVKKHLASDKSVHQPAKQDCLQCHSPHGSANKGLLKSPQVELCRSCHQKVYHRSEKARSAHALSTQKRGCLGCHQPHSSKHPHLQTLAQKGLCLSCHREDVKAASGRVIQGIQQNIGKSLHPPFQKGLCLDCHQPHQSLHAWLLRARLPTSVYVPYAKKQYKLCFACHKSDLAERQWARLDETRFRNGSLNLHFLHVNKAQRGRSCITCHASHGTQQHGLIRSSLPYGEKGWKLPIKFQKKTQGGGCVSGCHAPKEYDRKKPIQRGYLLHPPPYR